MRYATRVSCIVDRVTVIESLETFSSETAAADPPAPPNQPSPETSGKPNAFDQAISLQLLRQAADDYASRHGPRGSSAYRAAWLRFRQHIHSIDDLHRMRAQAARPSVRTQAKRTQAKRAQAKRTQAKR